MKNTNTQLIFNNVSQIIKKKPNKAELRSYLDNMLLIDNLGNDSYGKDMGCNIFKIYNFIISKFIPEYYCEHHVDQFFDPNAFNRYAIVRNTVENFSDEEIEYVLKQNQVYPEFIFGIKTSKNTENYFDSCYTSVKYFDPINKIIVFQCFMSELSQLCNEQNHITCFCREIVIHSEDTFVVRLLDIATYSICKHLNGELEYINSIFELHELNDKNNLIKFEPVFLMTIISLM